MLYALLFLVRLYPFWAIPLALVFFELGMYHYNRRERILTLISFGSVSFFVITSGWWIFAEGYWTAGPFVKKFFEGLSFSYF